MGLSIAATLLAVALVAGLLAWVRRDLRVRGASPRVWWLVVACYAFAALAWLVAITIPLPIAVAWIATIPAAVATVVPERLAARLGTFGGGTGRRRRQGPRAHAMAHPTGAPRHMASRSGGTGSRTGILRGRSSTVPGKSPEAPRPSSGVPSPWPAPAPTSSAPTPAAPESSAAAPVAVSARRSVAVNRRRWHAGDLRLAVELLEDAARIPDLDDAARARIEARLERLGRFREPATDELLLLVRDDVHARLAADAPGADQDAERTWRIAALLDELDPLPEAGRP